MTNATGVLASTAPLVYGTAAVLVVLGMLLATIGVHLVRTSRADPIALGPLEVMGERSWWQSDPAHRNAKLAHARPDGAAAVVDGSHATMTVPTPAPLASSAPDVGAAPDDATTPIEVAATTDRDDQSWAPGPADETTIDPSLTGPTPMPGPQPAPPIPSPPGPGPDPQPSPPTPMPPLPGPEPQPAPPIPSPPGPGPEPAPHPMPPMPGPPPAPDPVPQPGPVPGPVPGPEPGPVPQPMPPIPAVDAADSSGH